MGGSVSRAVGPTPNTEAEGLSPAEDEDTEQQTGNLLAGVTMAGLLDLYRATEGCATPAQVLDRVVLPQTSAAQSNYLALLPEEQIRPPTHIVSHHPECSWSSLIRALLEHFHLDIRDVKKSNFFEDNHTTLHDTVLWLDLLSGNHHGDSDPGSTHHSTTNIYSSASNICQELTSQDSYGCVAEASNSSMNSAGRRTRDTSSGFNSSLIREVIQATQETIILIDSEGLVCGYPPAVFALAVSLESKGPASTSFASCIAPADWPALMHTFSKISVNPNAPGLSQSQRSMLSELPKQGHASTAARGIYTGILSIAERQYSLALPILASIPQQPDPVTITLSRNGSGGGLPGCSDLLSNGTSGSHPRTTRQSTTGADTRALSPPRNNRHSADAASTPLPPPTSVPFGTCSSMPRLPSSARGAALPFAIPAASAALRSSVESCRRYAYLLEAEGRWAEAEVGLRRINPFIETKFGPRSHAMAELLLDLARLQSCQGLMSQAEVLCRQSHEIMERVYGPKHYLSSRVLVQLATILEGLDQVETAEDVLSGALTVADTALGHSHETTHMVLRALAHNLAKQKRWEEAEVLFQELLSKLERRQPGHPDPLDHSAAAADLADDIQQLQIKSGGANELYDRGVCMCHGMCTPDMDKRRTDADRLYLDGMRARAQTFGDTHAVTLDLILRYAQFQNIGGQVSEAEGLCREVLAHCTDLLGPQHRLTLQAHMQLGDTLRTAGQLAAAEEAHMAVWQQLQQLNLAAEDARRIRMLNSLALVQKGLGKYPEAIASKEAALQLTELALGVHHEALMSGYVLLGAMRQANGSLAAAEAAFAKAAEISMHRNGMYNQTTKKIYRHLKANYELQGKDTDAQILDTMYKLAKGPQLLYEVE